MNPKKRKIYRQKMLKGGGNEAKQRKTYKDCFYQCIYQDFNRCIKRKITLSTTEHCCDCIIAQPDDLRLTKERML